MHFFKHAIRRLREKGHEILISARAKDVTTRLLEAYGLEYRELSALRGGRLGMAREYLERQFGLLRLIRRFRPHVLAAIGGVFVAPAGRLTGRPSVVFTDTEHVALDSFLTFPWATRIVTPAVFKKELGPAQVRYDGFQELAYLYPRYLRPDPALRADLGLAGAERFALLRFVSWQASHDVGHSGLGAELKRRAIERLSRHGRVFVSTESELPAELAPHALAVAPERAHDVLAQASLYFGEGATMATESGLLGTPSVYVSSLVGTMGNFDALESAGLVHSFRDGEAALERAEALFADAGAEERWRRRSRALAESSADVTDLVCRQILEIGSTTNC